MLPISVIQFLFDGRPRWSGLWESPNQLGAFIAMILPFVWAIQRTGARLRWLSLPTFLIESALYFVLVRTYSRSGVLASLAAAAVLLTFVLVNRFREKHSLRVGIAELAPIFLRVILVGILLLSLGMGKRMEAKLLQEDASITNRLSTMQNSLRMLTDRPLTGWGLHCATTYVNWYQPLDSNLALSNLLSGNIEAAVELGLPRFWLMLAAILWCATGPICFPATREAGGGRPEGFLYRLSIAASSACAAFLTANTFCVHTAIISLFLFFLLCVGSLAVMRLALFRTQASRALLVSGVVSLLVCIVLFSVGWYERRSTNVAVSITEDEVILTPLNATDRHSVIDVWPDKAVLGEYYGVPLRTLATSLNGHSAFCVRLSSRSRKQHADLDIYFGHSCNYLSADNPTRLVLIHPVATTFMVTIPVGTVVVLPEFDEIGQNKYWQEKAQMAKATVVIAPHVGLDLRCALRETFAKITTTITNENL